MHSGQEAGRRNGDSSLESVPAMSTAFRTPDGCQELLLAEPSFAGRTAEAVGSLPQSQRLSIAMDLHDFIIQRLYAAGLSLQTLRGHVPPGPSTDRFNAVAESLDAAIREVRDVISTLNGMPRQFFSLEEELACVPADA